MKRRSELLLLLVLLVVLLPLPLSLLLLTSFMCYWQQLSLFIYVACRRACCGQLSVVCALWSSSLPQFVTTFALRMLYLYFIVVYFCILFPFAVQLCIFLYAAMCSLCSAMASACSCCVYCCCCLIQFLATCWYTNAEAAARRSLSRLFRQMSSELLHQVNQAMSFAAKWSVKLSAGRAWRAVNKMELIVCHYFILLYCTIFEFLLIFADCYLYCFILGVFAAEWQRGILLTVIVCHTCNT